MTIEKVYEVAGGSINEVMQRIPSKALLVKLVRMFGDDPSKSQLDKEIEAGDPVSAFKAVHTMKGVTLSLGFDALSEPVKALTENLRPGSFGEGWEENYAKVCEVYQIVIDAINQLED